VFAFRLSFTLGNFLGTIILTSAAIKVHRAWLDARPSGKGGSGATTLLHRDHKCFSSNGSLESALPTPPADEEPLPPEPPVLPLLLLLPPAVAALLLLLPFFFFFLLLLLPPLPPEEDKDEEEGECKPLPRRWLRKAARAVAGAARK